MNKANQRRNGEIDNSAVMGIFGESIWISLCTAIAS